MFNFIRDAVAVFKIRSVMGNEANWISEVDFPNVQIGSILPVIVATFPSGDIRSIHCNRNDRPKVMDKFVEAGISVVAADLEVVSLRSGKIEGFKLIPDYSTKVTIHKSPSPCEYYRLKRLFSEITEANGLQFSAMSRFRDVDLGDSFYGIVITHPSGTVSHRVLTTKEPVASRVALFDQAVCKFTEHGYKVAEVNFKAVEVKKGRVQAYTFSECFHR